MQVGEKKAVLREPRFRIEPSMDELKKLWRVVVHFVDEFVLILCVLEC